MDLAKAGDPYIGNDGREIAPSSQADTGLDEVTDIRRALPLFSKLRVAKNIVIDDLPEQENSQQVVIAAVVGLRMMGLSAVQISEIMNAPLAIVEGIFNGASTQATFEVIYRNMISANSESIQGRIASYAGKAVDTVVSLMETEEVRDDVRLKAAQDILDRSGSNAEQFFADGNESKKSDDELKIVVMSEDGESEKVRVDIKRGR